MRVNGAEKAVGVGIVATNESQRAAFGSMKGGLARFGAVGEGGGNFGELG